MSLIKEDKEIDILREAGKRLAQVIDTVSKKVAPGVTTQALNGEAEEMIRGGGDVPSFLGYRPHRMQKPYPATLCVSVNDEVVHGIPGERELKEGDLVGLDLGLIHQGLFVDMAVTVPCGSISESEEKLLYVCKKALSLGIDAIVPGKHVGAIGAAVEKYVESFGFGLVRDLGGHGVGHAVHEEPYIPNFGNEGDGMSLKKNMVLAIEPMITLGLSDVHTGEDGYTIKTNDASKSAHFEHTVVVTQDDVEILTLLDK